MLLEFLTNVLIIPKIKSKLRFFAVTLQIVDWEKQHLKGLESMRK